VIQGIGIDNAARITYFSLVSNIQNMSQYPDARAAAITAARIIFGDCSFEVVQTTNAWAAVGVGNVFAGDCLELDGPTEVCVDRDAPVVFSANAPIGAMITWNVPINWVFILSGPGNNTLTLSDILPPEPTESQVITIHATSSLGGTADFSFTINCFFHPCDEEVQGLVINPYLQNGNSTNGNELTPYPNVANDFVLNNTTVDEITLYPNPTK